MEYFNRIFFRGFFTLLPIALTIYIIYSAILILENLLGSVLRLALPAEFYIPGSGFLLTLFVIFMFGLILNNFLAERIYDGIETRLLRIPFFKAIYSPLKDLMNLFSKKDAQSPRSVVLLDFNGVRMIGIVTRENFTDLKLNNELADRVAVYLPFSYGMGGYTILANRDAITPIDMPIERAMSLAITGWVKSDKPVIKEMAKEMRANDV